jgi:hypothetical protein
MDQRTRDVQEDLKNIDRTRAALDQKLQLLDRHIDDTVREAKAAALEAVDHASGKLSDLLDTVGRGPIPHLFSRAASRPLTLVGGLVALGLLTAWMDRRRRDTGIHPYFPSKARGVEMMPDDRDARTERGVYPFFPPVESRRFDDRGISGEAGHESRQHRRTFFQTVRDDLNEELRCEGERLREAVVHAGRSLFRDLTNAAGAMLIERLAHPPAERRESVRMDRLPEPRRLP